jgi:hypothetical protein
VAGGVYVVGAPLAVSVGKTVPHGAGEHATVQVTPWCAGSPTTVAVSWAVAPTVTLAGGGLMETLIWRPAGTMTVAEPDAEVAVREVAKILTIKSAAGALAGAV